MEAHTVRLVQPVQQTQAIDSASYLRIRQVLELIPVSQSTIWYWCRRGTFPRPVRLSAAVSAWRAADVLDWLQKKADEQTNVETR